MNDTTYERALEVGLHPLRDYIWVVTESDGQLDHKASGAFFSKQDATDFITHQKSLCPDKIFGMEREFWAFTRRLFESRTKFLEELVEKSKAITPDTEALIKEKIIQLEHFYDYVSDIQSAAKIDGWFFCVKKSFRYDSSKGGGEMSESKEKIKKKYLCGFHCSLPVYALRQYHEGQVCDVIGVFTNRELAEEEREKHLAYYGGIDILPMNPDRTINPLTECPDCWVESGEQADDWTEEGLVG